MVRLVGISGSLRAGSFNTALLRAAEGVLPEGAALSHRDLKGVPLYDGDLEAAEGIPTAVAALKSAIAEADGLLLATPEYNGGVPGVMKNAIDWLSRPPADIPKVFRGKPVAIMGATPGGTGTANAQNAWLPIFRALRTRLWVEGGPLLAPAAGKLFDGEGRLVDDAFRERLTAYMAAFVDHLRA